MITERMLATVQASAPKLFIAKTADGRDRILIDEPSSISSVICVHGTKVETELLDNTLVFFLFDTITGKYEEIFIAKSFFETKSKKLGENLNENRDNRTR